MACLRQPLTIWHRVAVALCAELSPEGLHKHTQQVLAAGFQASRQHMHQHKATFITCNAATITNRSPGTAYAVQNNHSHWAPITRGGSTPMPWLSRAISWASQAAMRHKINRCVDKHPGNHPFTQLNSTGCAVISLLCSLHVAEQICRPLT